MRAYYLCHLRWVNPDPISLSRYPCLLLLEASRFYFFFQLPNVLGHLSPVPSEFCKNAAGLRTLYTRLRCDMLEAIIMSNKAPKCSTYTPFFKSLTEQVKRRRRDLKKADAICAMKRCVKYSTKVRNGELIISFEPALGNKISECHPYIAIPSRLPELQTPAFSL